MHENEECKEILKTMCVLNKSEFNRMWSYQHEHVEGITKRIEELDEKN